MDQFDRCFLRRLKLNSVDADADADVFVSVYLFVSDSVSVYLFCLSAGRVASAFECRLFYSYFKYALTSEQHPSISISIFNLVVFSCGCFNYNLSAWWLDGDGDSDDDDGIDANVSQVFDFYLLLN